MVETPVVAIAMAADEFLLSSDGDKYTLDKTATGKTNLVNALRKINQEILEKAKSNKIIILSDIITPYAHNTFIQPAPWYSFLSNLSQSSSNVSIITDRGTIVPTCSKCHRRNAVYFVKLKEWKCNFCHSRLNTTENILSNMLTTYRLSNENKNRLKKSKPRKQVESKSSSLPYLFSKVVSKRLVLPSYRATTDNKTMGFLRNMDRICRRIRAEIVKEVMDQNGSSNKLDYRGWVDEWNDKHGKFSGYRRSSKLPFAALSVSDTIIGLCQNINESKTIPEVDDELWVVYWRNIIIDRKTKRIALPRMRGGCIQLPEDSKIPTGSYYLEISAPSRGELSIRFVMGGNLSPKYETIDGSHQRGRHRRNTREPRLKISDKK